MIFYIGFFIGAVFGVMLFKLIFSSLSKPWLTDTLTSYFRKTFTIYLSALMAVSWIAGMGNADGGAYAGWESFLSYLPPTIFLLIAEMLIEWKKQKRKILEPSKTIE